MTTPPSDHELERDADDDDPDAGDRRAPDIVDQYELPAIFVKEGTDNAPTTRPIVWSYVWKKQGAQLGFIDFHPVEEMCDLDQLRDAYGAGVYQVQGRGANKKDTVKQVTVTIGGAPGYGAQIVPAPSAVQKAEIDFAKIAAGIVAIATPALGVLKELWDRSEQRRREEREDAERRRSEEREREDNRQNTFMQTMTQLMTARNQDLEAMVRSHASSSSSSGGGGGARAAYSEGQADTLELIRLIKEEGIAGEDSESKLIHLVEAFMAGKTKGDHDQAAAGGAAAPANGAAAS